MKATITYEFNFPEDNEEFEIIKNAHEYCSALSDISRELRQWYKYGKKEKEVLDEILRTIDEVNIV